MLDIWMSGLARAGGIETRLEYVRPPCKAVKNPGYAARPKRLKKGLFRSVASIVAGLVAAWVNGLRRPVLGDPQRC